MNYEAQEQSDLKEEIADYLGQNHGGRESDLDAIEAAEYIVTQLAEPVIRSMVAQEIVDFAENSGVGAYGDYGPPAIAVSDAALIAKGQAE